MCKSVASADLDLGKREKITMINELLHTNQQHSSVIMELLKGTAREEISWVTFGALLEYLDEEGISIRRIPTVHNFMLFQQKKYYIPDLKNSAYATCYNGKVYILSQGAYSTRLQLDVTDLTDTRKRWSSIVASAVTLVRLRDAIRLTGASNAREDCQNFLYSISGIFV